MMVRLEKTATHTEPTGVREMPWSLNMSLCLDQNPTTQRKIVVDVENIRAFIQVSKSILYTHLQEIKADDVHIIFVSYIKEAH